MFPNAPLFPNVPFHFLIPYFSLSFIVNSNFEHKQIENLEDLLRVIFHGCIIILLAPLLFLDHNCI